VKHVTLGQANKLHLGSLQTSNERTINQLLINTVVDTCQLQMGMTELKPGSVWNTMPPHLHSRRNEVYFYFDVPEGQSVCHFMGQPTETRHLWMQNEQAVISPNWSIPRQPHQQLHFYLEWPEKISIYRYGCRKTY
jgi:4-deoxy-L-threo-5-hexosulose-uronate ketol-isomerase